MFYSVLELSLMMLLMERLGRQIQKLECMGQSAEEARKKEKTMMV